MQEGGATGKLEYSEKYECLLVYLRSLGPNNTPVFDNVRFMPR
jgi:hypothetical protein